MKPWHWNLILFILSSPILAIQGLVRLVRRMKLMRQSVQASVICRTCRGEIYLVGFWKCGCGFTYEGHLLRYCPICGSFPNMIRCYSCGSTEKVRL